jgi:hypothetical protein
MCGEVKSKAAEEKEVRTMGRPVDLDAETVKAASAGRSEEVLGSGVPHALTAEEVKRAAEGKSEEVVKSHLATRKR